MLWDGSGMGWGVVWCGYGREGSNPKYPGQRLEPQLVYDKIINVIKLLINRINMPWCVALKEVIQLF